VIEHEYLASAGSLHDQLVLIVIGEIDTFGELTLGVFRSQTDDHLDLLLPVYAAAPLHV
jgi:hypothetical protein